MLVFRGVSSKKIQLLKRCHIIHRWPRFLSPRRLIYTVDVHLFLHQQLHRWLMSLPAMEEICLEGDRSIIYPLPSLLTVVVIVSIIASSSSSLSSIVIIIVIIIIIIIIIIITIIITIIIRSSSRYLTSEKFLLVGKQT